MEYDTHPSAPDYDEHNTEVWEAWADAQDAEREEMAATYDGQGGSPLTYPEYAEMDAPF